MLSKDQYLKVSEYVLNFVRVEDRLKLPYAEHDSLRMKGSLRSLRDFETTQ